MRLYHSYAAVRSRETGRVTILAETWATAPGAVDPTVPAESNRIADDPASGRTWTNLLFVLDNEVRVSIQFADPADTERETLERQLAEARSTLAKTTATAAVANQAAEDAAAALATRDAAAARVAELEATLGINQPSPAPSRSVAVPTLEEVLAAGYSEEAAKQIVARQQARADALAANPDISDEDLEKVDVAPTPAITTPAPAPPSGETHDTVAASDAPADDGPSIASAQRKRR